MVNPGIKVGDIVYLRQDLVIGQEYNGLPYWEGMKPLKFQGFEVLEILKRSVYLKTNTYSWYYTFEMLDLGNTTFPSKENLMDFLK